MNLKILLTADTRQSQVGRSLLGNVNHFYKKIRKIEVCCLRSFLKHINWNTDTAMNHHPMVMLVIILMLPTMVNELFLLPAFAQL